MAETSKDETGGQRPKQPSVEAAAEPIESGEPQPHVPVEKVDDPIVDEFDDLDSQDEDSFERVLMDAETKTSKAGPGQAKPPVSPFAVLKSAPRMPNESIESASTPLPALMVSIEEDFFGASLDDSDLTAAFDVVVPAAPQAATASKPAAVPIMAAEAKEDLFAGLDLDLLPQDDELDLDILDKLEAANATRSSIKTTNTLYPSRPLPPPIKRANAMFARRNNPHTIPRSVPMKTPSFSVQANTHTRPLQTRSTQQSLRQRHTPAPKLPHIQNKQILPAKQPETVFIKPALPTSTPRRTRSSSYGSSSPIPHIPTPPMSTQAIFSNLDDLFPSSSQQARELEEEFPSQMLPLKTAPPVASRVPSQRAPSQRVASQRPPSQKIPSQRVASQRIPSQRVASQKVPSQPPSQQMPSQQPARFFTSSGGREQLSLALQRSRRTAAMEQLQERERSRREAGLALQQSARKRQKTGQNDKENVAPAVPGSQESDYGGQWLDNIALDLAF